MSRKQREHVHLRTNHPWTPLEDECLKKMAKGGAKVPRIATCLNRSTRSIRRRAEVLRISWRAAKFLWPKCMQRNESHWQTSAERQLSSYEEQWEMELRRRSDLLQEA